MAEKRDIEFIFVVRTFVKENRLSYQKLNEIGITSESKSTRANGFYHHMDWKFKEKYDENEDILIKYNPNFKS